MMLSLGFFPWAAELNRPRLHFTVCQDVLFKEENPQRQWCWAHWIWGYCCTVPIWFGEHQSGAKKWLERSLRQFSNSDGCFWKSQGSGDICSLQIAEVLPQDSSSPCQGTGEKNSVARMLFCLLPAGSYDHQRKALLLSDHAPAH